MGREYASPELANLIALRLAPAEFERRVREPLTNVEEEEINILVNWFLRRYPTAKERLAYARRKFLQYKKAHATHTAAAEVTDYLETARRLAHAHRTTDPTTLFVWLAPDPDEKLIRLLEVTPKVTAAGELFPVEFAPRPDLGVRFALSVLLLSPEEWDEVDAGRLALPEGWGKGQLRAI
jgi:hypothetical protein